MNRIKITAVQTAVLMSVFALGSKLLGFIRELVMAGCFGTSYITDAYVMAISIPNIIFAGIFSAIATAFIPLFSKKIEQIGVKAANAYTSNVIKILFAMSLISSALGLMFSDQIVYAFANGFKGETAELTSFFVKVTFSYVLFTSATGILESYLQYKNTFIPQIFIGYLQNLIIIILIMISAYTDYHLLVFGLFLANALRLVLIWYISRKKEFHYEISESKIKDSFREIMFMAIPVFLGTNITQISQFADKFLASQLTEGCVAALNYASLLNNLIMTLSVTALTTIMYPKIAQAKSLNDMQVFNRIIQKCFNVIIIIAIPFSLGAMLYSQQIVQVVFQRGAFTEAATMLTGTAYFYYSIGLTFTAINDLLVKVYYSLHDMKNPMIFAAVSVIIDVTLNLILINSMGHNGLALASSISYISYTVLSYIFLRKKFRNVVIIRSKNKIIAVLAGSVIAVGISYLFYMAFEMSVKSTNTYILLAQLGISILPAMFLYIWLLKILKVDEITIIKEVFKRN